MDNFIIEKTTYGFKITLKDRVCMHDLKNWYSKIATNFGKLPKDFSVLFDLQNVTPICSDAAQYLNMGRMFLIGKGMKRLLIIYDSSVKLIEVMRAFDQIPNFDERYICTKSYDDWAIKAYDWISKGVEP